MWLVIGLMNFALYWAIGAALGRSLWKIEPVELASKYEN
jgi:hypothetical protein